MLPLNQSGICDILTPLKVLCPSKTLYFNVYTIVQIGLYLIKHFYAFCTYR